MLKEWYLILNIASLQKEKTNLEGTNIPSGDKISSYIQVFLNSQWTTRNSFRNASWHAHWATFQTIAILFLKLRVFLFLSNVINLRVSIPSNQYIFYNRDNFLNFLYIQKLLKLLCFPPTSLQISRPFDSLPFIWFILFSLLRIFADNKSNTQIYQPEFNAEYQIPTSNNGCWTITFFGFCRLLFKVEITKKMCLGWFNNKIFPHL